MKLQKWAWTGIGMAMALGGCERSDTLNEQESRVPKQIGPSGSAIVDCKRGQRRKVELIL